MTTYSISLDDVDLALLPTRSFSNNFLKKELFELHLLTREGGKDLPTYRNHPCHVCAIDVPAPFLNEHIASVKHRANVRIATEASQRMRALITDTLPPVTTRAAERFCNSCTCIAGKDHEKTKEHRVSVIQDRMLCDLAKVYLGDDDIINDDKENEKANGFNDIKEKKHFNRNEQKETSKKLTKADHNVVKLTHTSINETGPNQNAVKPKEMNIKPTGEQNNIAYGHCTEFVKLNLAMYIKILNKATSSPKIEIRPVGDNIYVLVNDDRMIVSYDHFNSYIRQDGKIHCSLCEHSFEEAYEEVHKLSVVHVTSVMPVVADSHCVREVHEWWSHCILCNKMIWSSDIEVHKFTQRHMEARREATVPQVHTEMIVQNKNTLPNAPAKNAEVKSNNTSLPNQNSQKNAANKIPEPKNATVPNQNLQTKPAANVTELFAKYRNGSNNNMPQSAAGKKLEAKTKNKAVQNKNQEAIVSHVYVDSEDDINYPYTEEPNGSVRCVICDCVVPSCYSNRLDHLNGNKHAANLKKQFPPLLD